jgi:ABC-type bacteriocin/lantibiotic exporter with double-glycine peptidase domain
VAWLYKSSSVVRELKIFGILDKFIDNYRNLGLELAHINYNNYFYLRFPKIFLEITIIIVILLFSIIFYENLNHDNLNEILPIIGTYIIAAYRVLPSVNRLMNSFTQLKLYKPGLNEVKKILLLSSANSNKRAINNRKYYKFNELNFKNVSFGYLEKKEIFSKINLKIKKKDKVFIFGKTGKGKSTFLNLIIGLIKPSSGKISYNNKSYELSDMVNNNTLSYAPQNTHLFDKSMQFNISLSESMSAKNYEILIKSVKSSELNEFFDLISCKKDVDVGESGNRLSGGQKQRVGIARCLYKNSEIIILDEATSSLDTYTELKVLTNIFKNYSDKTIIFVSHKRDLIKKFAFNKIFELKNKNIAEIND